MSDKLYIYGEEKIVKIDQTYKDFLLCCNNSNRDIELITAHKCLETTLKDILKNKVIPHIEEKLTIFSTDSFIEEENYCVKVYARSSFIIGLVPCSFYFFKKCREIKSRWIDGKIKELQMQGFNDIGIIMNSDTYKALKEVGLVQSDDGLPRCVFGDEESYPIIKADEQKIEDGYIKFIYGKD